MGEWGDTGARRGEWRVCRLEPCTWQSFGTRPQSTTPHAFEARALLIDYQQREEFDPMRQYKIMRSKRKRYDPVEFYLANSIAEWNDGHLPFAVHRALQDLRREAEVPDADAEQRVYLHAGFGSEAEARAAAAMIHAGVTDGVPLTHVFCSPLARAESTLRRKESTSSDAAVISAWVRGLSASAMGRMSSMVAPVSWQVYS